MIRLVFALLLVLLGPPAAQAQIPARERQLVYGVNAFTWTGYAGSLSARRSHTIYLIAGHPSIVSAQETLVYYWPITGEYRADWSALNADVAGTLEVLNAGRALTTLRRQPYVIQQPHGSAGPSALYTGGEAERRYHAFVEARSRYRDALARYHEARGRYLAALDNAVTARRRGERVSLPSPPNEPEAFQMFSTDVHSGFVINLPAGQYTIRMLAPDGQTVAGSQRALVIFTHRRESAGFTIVPQSRWTVPERADEPASTIYVRRDQVLYVQPFVAREYDDLAYARLSNPQSREGRPDGRRWEYIRPLSGGQLHVTGVSDAATITGRPYRVEQSSGEALGYKVVEPRSGEAADFTAFRVPIRGPMRIVLLDDAGGRVPGGERVVLVPRQGPAWPLGLITLIPMTVGAAVVSWRRERLRRTPRPREA